MNYLSYRIIWKQLLDRRYEFLVDGKPLLEIVETRNKEGVPLWIRSSVIPWVPLQGDNPHRMMIAICHCGEWGCGHDDCELELNERFAVMSQFCKWKDEPPMTEFEFSRENYNAVVSAIQVEAEFYQKFSQSYVTAIESTGNANVQAVILAELRRGIAVKDPFQKQQVIGLVKRIVNCDRENLKHPNLPKYRLLKDGEADKHLHELLDDFS